MKKSNIQFAKSGRFNIGLMLVLLSMIAILIPSCSKEDDTPPPSAYVPPEPDTTGACVYVFVTPELIDDGVIDFECEGPEYMTFGELEGSFTIEHADNPARDGINTSERAIQVIQTPTLEPWAGFFFDLTSKIDFSTYQAVKIKVYSPAAGQMINLKLEDSADGSIATELSVETTVANEWEELTFDFSSGDSDKFDRFVLFFDFFGPKDAETIHYFDDIRLGEGGDTGGGDDDPAPSFAAPSPTISDEMVISMFSNAYSDVPVDTWRTDWSAAVLLDTMIGGDDVKKYSELSFVGVETVMNQIDVSGMTHFRTDIWTANATELKVKLVDFGPDGGFDGGDDTEHEITIENPNLEEWVTLDLPLSEFAGLTTRQNIAQLIYSAAPGGQATVFIDNVYFYNGEGLFSSPEFPAPDPIFPEENVISLFSDSYTDVPIDTWRTEWSAADFEEVDVMGNAVLKYSNLNFVGAETVMNTVDASSMTHFHADVWTPDAELFRIKIVDFGADGAFGGDDDVEHELIFENPTRAEWISIDVELSQFENLTTRSNLAQYIFSGDPAGAMTLFVDNIYFHNNMEPPTEPQVAAPTPTLDPANVISMFSDAYDDVPVDTWRTDWSAADFEEVEVMGDKVLKYSNLNFVGAETVANQIDASGMTHFHIDIWTPDSELFRIKLVDFGADGGFDGGDDVEHELSFENPDQGQWISLDIELSQFEGLVTKENLAQYIFSGTPSGAFTVFIDNVYFHN